jgi:Leucine-rich repeat (LRR) protein
VNEIIQAYLIDDRKLQFHHHSTAQKVLLVKLPTLISRWVMIPVLLGFASCQEAETRAPESSSQAPAESKLAAPKLAQAPKTYQDDPSVVTQLDSLKPGIRRNQRNNISLVDLTGMDFEPTTVELLSQLQEIEVLKFRQTNVSDEGLGKLIHLPLRAIDLRNTNITDAGLTHLTDIKSLIDVQLEKTKVTDDGIAKLSDLKLKSFNGNYCPSVSNRSFKVICSIPTIEQIQMDYTKLDDDGMNAVAAAKNLKRLRIRGCDVTGKGLASLAGLERLQRLNLRDTSVDDQGLEIISKKSDVTFLDLSECRLVTPQGLANIGAMTSLTWLSLWETKANDQTLKTFGGLSQLQTLDLKATQITDESLPVLMKMQKLKELNLMGTQLSDQSFRSIGTLPELKKLNVANTSIGYDVVDELTESRPDLELIEY